MSRRLRDGEDPLGLIAEMKERLKRTKIILLLGGRNEEAGLPESERHGIVDWVAKNESRAHILEAVDKWIGRVATQPGT